MKFPTPECSDSGRTFTSLELKKLLLFFNKSKNFTFLKGLGENAYLVVDLLQANGKETFKAYGVFRGSK